MGAYYAHLSPTHFRLPDVAGLADSLERDIASPDPESIFLVVETHGDVVAAIAAHVTKPAPGAATDFNVDASAVQLHIDYLVTTASERRSGLATQLVREVEHWGRSRGATLAVASTFAHSPLSMPFWHERMEYETRSVNLRKRL